MKYFAQIIATVIVAASSPAAVLAAENTPMALGLAGTWELRMGHQEDNSVALPKDGFTGRIELPGSLAQRGKGGRIAKHPMVNELASEFTFKGVAWYRRSVVIPKEWDGLAGEIFIERSKLTRVWLGETCLGFRDSLGTPQVFRIDALRAGEHTLTVAVDNRSKPAEGVGGHMITTSIQTNWNGLLGKLRLTAVPVIAVDSLRVEGDPAGRKIRLLAGVNNRGGTSVDARLEAQAKPINSPRAAGRQVVTTRHTTAAAPGTSQIAIEIDLGPDALLWDEFDPALYEIALSLQTGDGPMRQVRTMETGLRAFAREGSGFAINGRKVMLRGKHDAMLFPLTGYASMDVDDWMKVMRVAKEYGINHYRFHSCTPPDAAFTAADRLGIYLQPELYHFGGKYAGHGYDLEEGRAILAAYGHHPSFVMFSLGNEIGGGREDRARHIAEFRRIDPGRLYAQGSNNEFWNPVLAGGDDYWTTARTQRDSATHAVRGSFSHADKPLGHVQDQRPGTMRDYRKAIEGVPVPVIGHETGQYQVFPRFSEIAKFTGVQKPWNLEVFRHRLQQAGMLDQADAFVAASGALVARCYREEIETCLRTPGFGGFQLLDLQDFPGQGTALVGILDSFMDSKGAIQARAWREFCSPTVLLARMPSYTWSTTQYFGADLQLAHYGRDDLPAGEVEWQLLSGSGGILRSGAHRTEWIKQGTLASLGHLRIPLENLPAPASMTLRLTLKHMGITTHYPLWLYPAATDPVAIPAGVDLRRHWDSETKELLAAGRTVLLLPDPSGMQGVEGFFAPDFWCYPMFRSICEGGKKPVAPGTHGLLIQADHPALAAFPTATHSDWQWYDLVMDGKAMILDGLPLAHRPVVQVIDNFERNHRLGALLEAKIGKGRLILCSLGLLEKQQTSSVARQLLTSLVDHAASAYLPATSLEPADLDKVFAPPVRKPTGASDAGFSEFFNRQE